MLIQRNNRTPDAIITSDWHMMEPGYNPPCRLDNHFEAQADKVSQIKRLQSQWKCPVINAGDIFDHWKPSPELINHCHRIFPKDMATVAGNHDLPGHNIKLIHKSGFQSLWNSNDIYFLYNQVSWKTYDPERIANYNYLLLGEPSRKIAVAHMLTWEDEEPYPGCTAPRTDKLFDMFPNADLIVTGDNHRSFTARQGNRLLINPGSLTRFRAIQIDHRPCVYLWYADSNTYQIHYLKVSPGVVSRDHIDNEKEIRDNKDLFLDKLDGEWETNLSFEDNLVHAMDRNRLPNSISKYVNKWVDTCQQKRK